MRKISNQYHSQIRIHVVVAIQSDQLPFRISIYLDLNSIVQFFRPMMNVFFDGAVQDDLMVRSNHYEHQNRAVALDADLSQNGFDNVDHSMCCH